MRKDAGCAGKKNHWVPTVCLIDKNNLRDKNTSFIEMSTCDPSKYKMRNSCLLYQNDAWEHQTHRFRSTKFLSVKL